MPLVYSPPLIAGGACPLLLQDDKFHDLTEKMAASNGPADPPEEPLNVPSITTVFISHRYSQGPKDVAAREN